MQQQNPPLRSVGQLLKEAWHRYTSGLSVYFPLTLIVVLPTLIARLLLDPIPGIGSLVVFLISLVAGAIAGVSLILAVSDEAKEIWRAYYDRSRPSLLRYLGVQVVRGILQIVGFMLLIIPGIIFMVWFIFADIIVVLEGLSPFEALRKSRSYVKGYGLAIAERLFIFILLLIPFMLVFGLLKSMLPFSAGDLIAESLLSALLLPWGISYFVTLYHDVVSTRGAMMVQEV